MHCMYIKSILYPIIADNKTSRISYCYQMTEKGWLRNGIYIKPSSDNGCLQRNVLVKKQPFPQTLRETKHLAGLVRYAV
jgi:hypothetical protein